LVSQGVLVVMIPGANTTFWNQHQHEISEQEPEIVDAEENNEIQ